jgi:hypothetical protein
MDRGLAEVGLTVPRAHLLWQVQQADRRRSADRWTR